MGLTSCQAKERAGRDLAVRGHNRGPSLFPGTASPSELLSCHPWFPAFSLGFYAFPGSDLPHLSNLASVCDFYLSYFVQLYLTYCLTAFSPQFSGFLRSLSEDYAAVLCKTEPEIMDSWAKQRRVTVEALPWSLHFRGCVLSRLVWEIWHTPRLLWWHKS